MMQGDGLIPFFCALCVAALSASDVPALDGKADIIHLAENQTKGNQVEQVFVVGQKLALEEKADIVTNAIVKFTFRRCRRSSDTCVVDGDTIRLASEKIRVADIDTPEVRTPTCASEKILGEKATERLIVLLNEGPFEVVKVGDRDEDRYGRKLRILVRDGHSLGDQLVSEGLARTWSGAREPWC